MVTYMPYCRYCQFVLEIASAIAIFSQTVADVHSCNKLIGSDVRYI